MCIYSYLKTQMTHTLEDLTYKMKDEPPPPGTGGNYVLDVCVYIMHSKILGPLQKKKLEDALRANWFNKGGSTIYNLN